MSLEKMLEANTAAVEANTEVLKAILANQEKALAGISGKADDAAEETPRRSRRERTAEEPAAEETSRRSRRERAEEPAAEETPRRSRREAAADDAEETPRRSRREAAADEDETPRRSAREKKEEKSKKEEKPKKLTIDDVKAAFADLLDTAADDAQEDERRDFIESILDELAVEKTTQIVEKDFADVLAWVADKKAGKKVTF